MSRGDGDLVVIGASAGGIEPLLQLVAKLPGDLAAPVLITVHVSASGRGALPSMLERAGALSSVHARDGEPLTPGRLVVAVPDHHLLVAGASVRVTHGPREHHHRPSIDKLFRSAVAARGPRVIGVLLSGALDDGVAGLAALARAGGRVVVQAPQTAAYDSMPSRALEALKPDAVLEPETLGSGLVELIGDRSAGEHGPPGPDDSLPAALGPSPLRCPECAGVIDRLPVHEDRCDG
jgi:two-component system chemotaxis response regulator CheB